MSIEPSSGVVPGFTAAGVGSGGGSGNAVVFTATLVVSEAGAVAGDVAVVIGDESLDAARKLAFACTGVKQGFSALDVGGARIAEVSPPGRTHCQDFSR
jgi:hypothetical protein